MGRLSEAYEAAGGVDLATGGSAEALEARLEAFCARGRAAHPELSVGDEVFVAHLARCGAAVGPGAGETHVEDLYLACACLEGDSIAIERARNVHRPVLTRYLQRVGGAGANFDEIEQRLWDGLLVGSPPGTKLSTYSGQGPLSSWLGVSAQRIALMMLRHEGAEGRARHQMVAQDPTIPPDPELAAIKARLREPFQRAVESALSVLDDREKTLYRLHLVDGLTLERIGKAYSVSTSTVFRWIESARVRVLDEARRLLRENLEISTEEFESIARLLVSQLDLNISLVLGKVP